MTAIAVWWVDRPAVRVLPCSGRSALYFADEAASQRAAVRLCQGCPMLGPCRRRVLALEADGVMAGVWGGWTRAERRRMAAG